MSKPSDLIQGTLDLLILKTISLAPQHGWAIAKRIQQVSSDALRITQGALYPALHRLEQQAWITAEWGQTDSGREAKFYTLTPAGRTQLAKELAEWERLSGAVGMVIALVPENPV
jgi:PadR family transcriptional regulator PadR